MSTSSIQLPFTTSHAFIVGINAYQHLTPLHTAVNDARVIAEHLADQHDFTVHPPLLNATHQSLRKLLREDIPKLVGEDDRVLFYFAGHGIALDGETGPNGYLVSADTRPGQEETLLPMQVLHDELTALPCRHGLLILDCCFSGAFKWSSGFRDVVFDLPKIIYEERFWRYCKDPAWQVITSSAYDQKAVDIITNQSLGLREAGNADHSPFAASLLKALGGAGDTVPPGGNGVITATELYTYLRDSVETQTTENAKRQSPSIFNLRRHDKGEFIFLNPNHRFNLPPTPDRNPFLGLSSYNEEDASLFYGRDRVVETLLALVKKQSLVVVSGASGTGKSSVIKAGVLPALRQSGYHILPIIRPGKEPIQTIIAELPDFDQQIAQGPTVLVIDQYEELITQCLHPEERQAFEQKMANALKKHLDLRIVLSIRSDFEPQFESEILAPWWQAGRYVVPSFSLEEIREIISKPATQAVLFYEPEELVESLSEEVNQAPGALPLLSFTLSELYHKYLKSGREDRALIQQDYNELGGVVGALRTRADAEYLALSESEQSSMRKLMLRMVSIEGGELAGKRVYAKELEFSDLAKTQSVQTIADRLVDVRLLVKGTDGQGRSYIEPAHDALVRAWSRLWEWIKTVGEEKIALQYKLNQAVNDYHGLLETEPQKARNLLWNNNPRLDLLQAELQRKDHGLNVQEESFVRSSVQRRSQRKRTAWGIAVAVMVGLASLAVFAFTKAELASNNAAEAEKQRLVAVENEKAAQNASLVLTIAKNNPTLALSIASYNLEKHPGNSAAIAAFREVINDPKNKFYKESFRHTSEINAVAFSPDGQTILTGSDDKVAKLWDRDGQEIQTFHGHSDFVNAVAFSPDGQTILTGSRDKTAKLWDMEGQEIRTFQGHSSYVNAVAFSPDGQTILTGSNDNTAKLWGMDGQEIQAFRHSAEVWAVAFSPDGQTVLTGSRDKTAKLWGLQGQNLQTFKGHAYSVKAVAFSPDGQTILTGSFDKTARLWDRSGREIQTLHGHSASLNAVAFSPDGQTMLTGDSYGIAKLWDKSGQEIQTLQGHSYSLNAVAFSPDGQTILTGSDDHTAKLWEGQEIQTFKGHSNYINAVAFSPDGQTILTGSFDNTAKLWNRSGQEIQTLRGHSNYVNAVVFSPDGQTILTGSDDHTAKLWNREGQEIQAFKGHSYTVNAVAFSPDGQTILTGSSDNTAKLWSRSGQEIQTIEGRYHSFNAVAFSPDGQTILTGSRDNTAKLWNKDGQEIQAFRHSAFVNAAVFSPDGQTILTGSSDGTAKLWNRSGQEIQTFQHSAEVYEVAFSPDGQTILTRGGDKTVKLWDRSGQEIQAFRHSSSVYGVAFSPDGQTILTGSSDKMAKLSLTPQAFVDQKVHAFTLQELYDAGVILETEDLEQVEQR